MGKQNLQRFLREKGGYIMATLNRKKSGCWSIQYDLPGERRKTITLPSRFEQQTAEDMRKTIGKLIYFQENGDRKSVV